MSATPGKRKLTRNQTNPNLPIRRMDAKTRKQMTDTFVLSLDRDIMDEEAFERLDDEETVTSTVGGRQKRKKRSRQEILSKTNEKRSLTQIIASETSGDSKPSYATIEVTASAFKPRPLCTICGFEALQHCLHCGYRVCSVKCLTAHVETKCGKSSR